MQMEYKDVADGLYYDQLKGDQLRKFQLEKIRSVLKYVDVNSKYYHRMFREAGFNADTFSCLEDIERIPFTDKEQLQQWNLDFLNVHLSKVAEYVTTSGTLGRPVQLMLTEHDLIRLAYNEARGLTIAGISAEDVVQITTTLDRRFMAGLAYYLGCRLIGSATIRVGVGAPQLQWETIIDMSPTVLIGVPSFIVKLIEYAQKAGIEVRNSSVKKVVCIGEPIRESGLEWNKVGQYINDNWGVALYSTYASTEMATAFTECYCGKGGHQLNELIYTEIIDEEGHVLGPNMVGELVVTTFGLEGMPLVRFKTGDLVERMEEKCACGRNSIRLSPVIGRKGQLIKFKGTTVYPSAIQQILDHVPEVETYVIEVVLNEFGEDHIQVLLAVKGDKERVLKNLKEQCQAHIRVSPEFLLREPSFVNHLRNRPEMRKPIVFIDNRIKKG